jgi:hypothetical protein
VGVFHGYVELATTKGTGKAYWRQLRVVSNRTTGTCVFRFALAFCVIKDEGRR